MTDNSWFKIIFYAVIVGLGFYILSLLMRIKKGDIPEAILPPHTVVKDADGFSKIVTPSGILFTILTFAFGIEGYLSYFGLFKALGKQVNTVIDIVFVLLFFVGFFFFYGKLQEAISKFAK